MDPLQNAQSLVRAGRFRQALESLRACSSSGANRLGVDVLRAELLERTGQYAQSRVLSEKLLRMSSATHAERSRCEFTLGLIDWDAGDTDPAITHFQRAVSQAELSKDLWRISWAQLRLIVTVAGRAGPAAVLPLLSRARWNTVKVGDPLMSAALHIFVGEMEAKRGLLHSAKRHTEVGQQLLGPSPNLWLEAVAENNHVAIALMRSEFDEGIVHGERALLLSQESGAAAMLRACFGNLGNLCWATGQFSKAIELFLKANAVLPSTGEYANGNLDSLARTYLGQERLDLAEECLERIDHSIQFPSDRALYANRYAQLTRTQLLIRRHRPIEALKSVELLIELAERADDRLLFHLGQITRARILPLLGRISESAQTLSKLVPTLPEHSPDVHALYEHALAEILLATGDGRRAKEHFDRASRIQKGLGGTPGIIELTRAWKEATSIGGAIAELDADLVLADDPRAGNMLQNISLLMMHVGRAELLASDLLVILRDAGCVTKADALSRAGDGSVQILGSFGDSCECDETEQIFQLGVARDRTVVVRVQPRADIESGATLDSLALLLGTIRDLERAHAEREERLALWPLEDNPIEDGDAVIMGHMRELMTFARRVAKTNMSVLITGESGTGKEIVARAIHAYSARAEKPFAPFNCTAVPREMLESQLFGHRRGAFTSADRDNPGLIRTAKGGSLFLDEVGELSLDLQPKLLRFLESGEICPLGESSPFNVDVRIIAATNRDLEQLVHEGRFREDLFYRLNVIRLPILPLRERRDEIPTLVHHFVASAAAECAKGQLRVAEETMEHFLLYAWPGNVRQLQNEIRRMVALADVDAVLTPAALSPEIRRAAPRAAVRANGDLELVVSLTDKLVPAVSHLEREMIRVALRTHHGRLDAAAKALGISRKGLYLKRRRLGL